MTKLFIRLCPANLTASCTEQPLALEINGETGKRLFEDGISRGRARQCDDIRSQERTFNRNGMLRCNDVFMTIPSR